MKLSDYLGRTALGLGLLLGAAAWSGAQEPVPSNLEDEIESRLSADPLLADTVIDVDLLGGMATLSGSVDRLLERDRAEAITESFAGVKQIENRLELTPPQRSDEAILTDLRQALASNAAVQLENLRIRVDQGVVTLEGEAPSYPRKELPATLAKGIVGVHQVHNLIRFDHVEERPDEAIRTDIINSLRFDFAVDHRAIDVKVNDGVVTLSGSVPSALQKSLAMFDAWVAGAKEVDAGGLQIAPAQPSEDIGLNSADDRERAIFQALRRSPYLTPDSLRVRILDDTAILVGEVESLRGRMEAEQQARQLPSIQRVDNRLRVEPRRSVPDKELERLVEGRLALESELESHEIEAEAQAGSVQLRGMVDSTYEQSRATEVVASVTGVLQVENRLEVGSEAFGRARARDNPQENNPPEQR